MIPAAENAAVVAGGVLVAEVASAVLEKVASAFGVGRSAPHIAHARPVKFELWKVQALHGQ